MKKYKVYWEVSKHAIVEAENAQQATEKVMEEDTEQVEDEITSPPEAVEIDINYEKLYGKMPELEKLDKEKLTMLFEEYDKYIQNANDADLYRSGWKPVCISEFYDNEFQEILEEK